MTQKSQTNTKVTTTTKKQTKKHTYTFFNIKNALLTIAFNAQGLMLISK